MVPSEREVPRSRSTRAARALDDPRVVAPLWVATGAAVVGVLLGGAAVFLGLQGRPIPPPVLPATPTAPASTLACEEPDPWDRPVATPEGERAAAPSLARAVARTRDTVVTLRSPQRAEGFLGTGVVVDPSGLVLTNFHVVAPLLGDPRRVGVGGPASTLTVRFANGREVPGVLVIGDREQDIALLRLRPADSAETFPAAALGRSAELDVGESVFAVGTPLGLEHSVSAGIVAALDRTHVLANRRLALIQLDASINFGNSGGPLFNLEGELVGITTAMVERAQGIGFAIPIDHIRALLRAFGEGSARRTGQVGIEADARKDLSPAAYRLGYRNGVVVDKVTPGLPAEAAGIRPGDVIVEVRGRRYDAFGEGPEARQRFAQNFVEMVRSLVPGESLEVAVVRGDGVVNLALTIAPATPHLQIAIDAEELLGLVLADEGPVVEAVRPGSEISGWRHIDRLIGARITRILDRPVQSRDDLGTALALLRQLVELGRQGTIAVSFTLKNGREVVVQDFPIDRL